MDYDVALKAIFQSHSSQFFFHLLGSRPVRQLSVEFVSVEKRIPDLVFELEDGRILHVELQVDNDPTMPWRMLQYYWLLRSNYRDHVVVQAVVYVGNARLRMSSEIDEGSLQFRYSLVDIRQFSGEVFLQSPSSSERALALLCPVPDARETIARVLRSWAEVPFDERNNLLETLVILSGLRGLKSVVQERLPSMAINTEVLIRDNEWFQEWKELGVKEGRQEGVKEGLQEGRQEGRQEGQKEGRSALLRRLIERKFGPLPQWAEDRLSGATAEQLDECALRILDASALEQIFG